MIATGIVDQDVGTAARRDLCCDGIGAGVGREVAQGDLCLTAGSADCLGSRIGTVFISPVDDYRHALRGQELGDRLAQPGRRSGNERAPSFQFQVHAHLRFVWPIYVYKCRLSGHTSLRVFDDVAWDFSGWFSVSGARLRLFVGSPTAGSAFSAARPFGLH